MNAELAMIRGKLASLDQEKFKLAARVQGKTRAVKLVLTQMAIRHLHEVDLRTAADELAEAADLRDRYVEVVEKIDALNAELG